METPAIVTEDTQRAIEKALIGGDLSDLSLEQRGALYQQVCASLGLNPLTQPFGYLQLQGKLRLYALKGCTDQLRALRKISIEIVSMKVEQDLFMVHVRARDEAGRVDEDVGFALITNKKGDDLGNAKLKAITKAKRRCTLSICGLGMLDESEVESIPTAKTYTADAVPEAPLALPPAEPEHPSQEQIDYLFQLAESCREPKEAFGSQLRRIMGLDGSVRITKKYLREAMTMDQLSAAEQHYTAILKAQVEDDVPTHEPPPATSAPAPQDDPEPTQGPPGATMTQELRETPAEVPLVADSSSVSAPADDPDAAAKAKLRAEVAGWALQVDEKEVEYILQHYAPEKARALLWGARRRKPEPTLIEAAAD
jgi:hypothetical protein